MKIFVLFAGLIFIWFLGHLLLLLSRNSKTLNNFKKIEQLYKKRYEILSKMEIPQEAAKYLEELKNLPDGTKFLNRKLALNYIVSKIFAEFVKPENFSDEYKLVNYELSAIGEIYNTSAAKLKTSVEISPTAFLARFLNIKTVDFYRG